MKHPVIAPILSMIESASKVPIEYRTLYNYLKGRYADTVVLSFVQIEGLLEATLPELAYSPEWWVTADATGSPSGQSRSWTEARRTARANLTARSVVFERVQER